MAKVFGAAGKHAGRQSVVAFKRMFTTVVIVAVVAAFFEGVVVTTFFTTHIRIGWIGLPVVTGILLLWLLNYANRRVDKHETDRLNWRKGALGEYEVGAELERLSDEFFIFNDLNTAGLGNFDHIVVGPTGLLSVIVRCSAIEYGSLSQPTACNFGTTNLRHVSASLGMKR